MDEDDLEVLRVPEDDAEHLSGAEARRAREEDGGERPAEERGAGAEEGRVRRGGARARDAGGEEELRVERRRVGRVGKDVGQGLGPLRPRGSGSGSGDPSLGTGLGLRHAGCEWGAAAAAAIPRHRGGHLKPEKTKPNRTEPNRPKCRSIRVLGFGFGPHLWFNSGYGLGFGS